DERGKISTRHSRRFHTRSGHPGGHPKSTPLWPHGWRCRRNFPPHATSLRKVDARRRLSWHVPPLRCLSLSASGPNGRGEQPPRAVACVAELLLQRPRARGRDGSPPARDEADRPVEGLDGSTEAPEHERATGGTGGGGEQVADPLTSAT